MKIYLMIYFSLVFVSTKAFEDHSFCQNVESIRKLDRIMNKRAEGILDDIVSEDSFEVLKSLERSSQDMYEIQRTKEWTKNFNVFNSNLLSRLIRENKFSSSFRLVKVENLNVISWSVKSPKWSRFEERAHLKWSKNGSIQLSFQYSDLEACEKGEPLDVQLLLTLRRSRSFLEEDEQRKIVVTFNLESF